jgi:hypothetical protein
MKLSLTVEADTINVLALNMGRIAVDIDGIELAALIDVVCDNGYSLRVADEPGKLVVEDPLPPVARINGIQCSTAHITRQDNTILDQTSFSDMTAATATGYCTPARLSAQAERPLISGPGAETNGVIKGLSPVSGDAYASLFRWHHSL